MTNISLCLNIHISKEFLFEMSAEKNIIRSIVLLYIDYKMSFSFLF
jgi:hypothetical protein